MNTEPSRIDLTQNAKQAAFFHAVMAEVSGRGAGNRYFAYGGAIRGGKTFVCLFLLILLAKRYPKSRWHVVRATDTLIRETSVQSFLKLAPGGVVVRNSPKVRATFPNGSTITFLAENIKADPDLNSFLGLETNGFLLEQAEELDPKTWEKVKQRVGSWSLPPDQMPPGLVLATFNPNDGWSRRVWYEPFFEGTLKPPYFYLPALPSDNPFVTADQWATWSEMDAVSQKIFITGDWDARRNDNAFYYAFSRTAHVREVEFNPALPVHLSFDQNVLPYLSLSCWQMHRDGDGVEWLQCFDIFPMRPPTATSSAAAEAFLAKYGDKVQTIFLYGDASGNKRDTRGVGTDYEIVKRILRRLLNNRSDRTFAQNPNIVKRREWINAIFAGKRPNKRIVIDPKCKELADDLHGVKTDANGHKFKQIATAEDGQRYEKFGHFSDTADYITTSIWEDDFARYSGGLMRISG